jgi:putative ABC transport system substrate-binding protein
MNNKIKKIFLILGAVFSINIMVIASPPNYKKILISQVVDHPALNITTKGIIDGIEENGFKRGINLEIRIESAQANISLAEQIATKFINQEPDIVVGVGTMSAQSFVKYARDNKVKLIFSSVTDPLGAGLVNSLNVPRNNSSGVSNFVDLEPQIKLFKIIQPKLKRLGILYNPSEINSVSIVNSLEKISPEFDIILIKQTITKTADVAQAATKLASLVDAIFISNDNTALGALSTIIKIANKVKVPVYVSDTDAVIFGALAALGPNQYQVGLQTGKMIAKVLNGADINLIPVECPDKSDLYINYDAALISNIIIPDSIKSQASKIIKNGKFSESQ